MEKIIHKLINEFTEGVDTYTHNNSTWLIFTEAKEWVIELTKNKALWYNYNFFKELFSLTSMDVVDNQHYITKWVEDNIINKELTYVTLFRDARDRKQQFEDTLENGVKETLKLECCEYTGDVDEVLENGVKETQFNSYENKSWVEGVIKKGVKETKSDDFNVSQFLCEEVIDKGIKETKISPTHTEYGDLLDGDERLDEIIRDGVKETNHVDVMKFFDNKMEDTLEKGVKSSIPRQYVGENIIDKIIDKGVIETHDDVYHHKGRIDGVIKNGVKETHREICEYKKTIDYIIKTGIKETKTPGEGDLKSTVEWMKENNSNSYSKMIDDVIETGIKEGKINNIIDNEVKVSGTFVGGNRQTENIESVIGYGTKNPTD